MKQSHKFGIVPEQFWTKDIDGNVLKTYRVGKFLITENLKTEHYNDGTPIPIVKDAEEWAKTTSGAMCYYDNDRKHKEECGALYNGYVDYEKLALTGWRIYTDEGWKELEIILGMSREDADKDGFRGNDIGDKMKEALGVVYSGYRDSSGRGFHNLDVEVNWWCPSISGVRAWYRELLMSCTSVVRSIESCSLGFSVRCVRELTEEEINILDKWILV